MTNKNWERRPALLIAIPDNWTARTVKAVWDITEDNPIPRGSVVQVVDLDECAGLFFVEFEGKIYAATPDELERTGRKDDTMRTDREKLLSTMRAYAEACESASVAEARTGIENALKRKSARARATELCKLLGLKATKGDLYYLAGMTPSKVHEDELRKPYPGAMLQRLYRISGKGDNHAAIRRRPGWLGYEVVSGREEGEAFVWSRLIALATTSEDAEHVIRLEFGNRVKEKPYA